jgi:ELWxxDGT repeat protein
MPNVLPAYGRGIWKTDGTDTGTIVVAPLQQDEYLNGLTNVNGTLFFMLSNDINGFELGKLDNATGNVVMIKDIYAGGNSSFPSLFVNFNNTLYFVAKDSLHGKELWKSDGTEIGTVLVKDICDGLEDSSPTALTIVGNKLFFQAYDTLHGRELWATDGTDAGTYLVKDVYLGTESGVYQEMISTGDTLYFAGVSDINTEMELWKSDGTDIGTTLVSNISPIGSSSPKNFAILNQLLLFTAFHEDYGNEFWKLGITNTLSIDDNNDFVNHNYLIYPNPTSEFVYLKGNISQNTNIIIYNSLGIAVLSKNIASSIAESSIDVSELSEGIYFLNLVNEKENISCKIIVKGY